ncbi:MAG TPA: hypothetical protein VNZ25_00325, partial [Candidatus Angelobacter sp.]|nr:hypothetical protein [Candidatus Angelobacter sp.]
MLNKIIVKLGQRQCCQLIPRQGFPGTRRLLLTLMIPGLLLGNSSLVRGQDLRPIYHFSASQGWLGDPCGFVYYAGEYQLCFQHTPNSTTA